MHKIRGFIKGLKNATLPVKLLVALLMFIMCVAVLFLIITPVEILSSEIKLGILIGASAAIIVMSSSLLFFNIISKTELLPFHVALLGFPRAGKTVYLTTLLHLLRDISIEEYAIAPLQSDTSSKISNDYLKMKENIRRNEELWLPKTANDVFRYDFIANKNTAYFVSVTDYPGEKMEAELLENGGWIHKSEYMDHVHSSRAFIVFVDLDQYVDRRSEYVEEITEKLVAALWEVKMKKQLFPRQKLLCPISILFAKSDKNKQVGSIYDNDIDSQRQVENDFSKLIDSFRNNAHYVSYSFVSSLDIVNGSEITPKALESFANSFLWLLDVNHKKGISRI